MRSTIGLVELPIREKRQGRRLAADLPNWQNDWVLVASPYGSVDKSWAFHDECHKISLKTKHLNSFCIFRWN